MFRCLISSVRFLFRSPVKLIIIAIITLSVLRSLRINSNSILTETDEIVEACHFPKLSLSFQGLGFMPHKIIRPVCYSKFSPVIIQNYSLRLIYKRLNCSVRFYLGHGDHFYQVKSISLVRDVNIPILSDHFTVRCNQTSTPHPDVPYITIRNDKKIRQRLATVRKQNDDLNILILGLDSISRLQYERMLPKTHAHIKKLNGTILKGYNILGDGTPAQVIPMLTGMLERELPSTLHRDANGSFVDVYPFIWNTLRDRGYVTGYSEDGTQIGIWTLRLKGFNQTPTDHYMLPFYRLPATSAYRSGQNPYCFGKQTTFELFLSYIQRFWTAYSKDKKFFFGFFKQYTHDGYEYGSLLDSSIVNLLDRLNKSRELDRTVVILMSDHGARFSSARLTPQGAIEERLPFMSFILPESFHRKYPHAINALQTNINRFTTPFDVHATLLSLLDMNKLTTTAKDINLTQRNISLFNIIPAQRTCDHIRLPPHWCSCLKWTKVNVNEEIIKKAAKHVVEYINKILSAQCRPLTLESIRGAQMYRSHKNFSASVQRGFRVLGHWNQTDGIIFYQITLTTKPNDAIYEATVQYTANTGHLNTNHNDISRLNAYKTSADCIVRSYPHLRKFCFCIK